jgi:hypothetical protein
VLAVVSKEVELAYETSRMGDGELRLTMGYELFLFSEGWVFLWFILVLILNKFEHYSTNSRNRHRFIIKPNKLR